MELDPRARSLLEMVYRVGAPKFHQLDEAQARRSMVKLQQAFQPDAPAVASVVEVPMPRADGSVLFARAYRPRGGAPSRALPGLVFMHGGGWCLGSVDTHDVLCRELCNASGVAVVSVDYRLAPEHPFPAAFEDVLTAFEWVVVHGGAMGIDPRRIALGGDSAGGNLALAAALQLRDRRDFKPAALGLIYPSVDLYADTDSRERFADGYFLDRETLQWFIERYLTHPGEALDWRVSPMLADTFSGMPPLILVTAQCDPLADEGLALAERFAHEGLPVWHHVAEGMVHGFITLGKLFPQAGEAIRRLGADLAGTLAEELPG